MKNEKNFLATVVMNKNDKQLYPFFRRAFMGWEKKENPDFFRVLCYTTGAKGNAYTRWTKQIREAIYGEEVPYMCVGEQIKLTAPLLEYDSEDPKAPGEMILSNNLSMKIVKVGQTEMVPFHNDFIPEDCAEIEALNVTASYYDFRVGMYVTKDIRIMTEQGKKKWFKAKRELSKLDREIRRSKGTTGHLWQYYYFLKDEIFCHFRYDYTRSTYTAQGGTFSVVMLDCEDLKRSKKVAGRTEWLRHLYVGMTRHSVGLILFNQTNFQ